MPLNLWNLLFCNYMKPKIYKYIFGYDSAGNFPAHVADIPSCYPRQLIGETLETLFLADRCPKGLQLVRLRYGSVTIIAHKRITDLKVTIYDYEPDTHF